MNKSDGISVCTVLEYVAHGGVEVPPVVVIEHQVEWSGPRTMTPSSPILRSVSPETPDLWSLRGDLKPMMANEKEVVRSLIKPVKVALEGDVPPENFAKYFGWELVHIQKQVPGAFELDDGSLVLSDLFLQSAYGIDVDLANHPIFRPRQD